MRMAPFREMLAGLTQLTTAQLDELRNTIDMLCTERLQYQYIETDCPRTDRHYGGTHFERSGMQGQRQPMILNDIGESWIADTTASSFRLRQRDEFDIYERCIENGLSIDEAADMANRFINTAGPQRSQVLRDIVEHQPRVVRAKLDENVSALLLQANLEQPDVAVLPSYNFIDNHAYTNASIAAVRDVVAVGEAESGRNRSVEATHATASTPAERGLTQRHSPVLLLMLEGLSNRDIGRRLGLTERTVRQHVSAILQRLGVHTRKQAMPGMESLRLQGALAGDIACSGRGACKEHDQSLVPAEGHSITPKELGLTQRQGAVLVAMLEGLPNKLIARRLGLSENTVKEHVSAILQRLGLRSRMEVMSKMKHLCVRFHL
ncbi:HTH-type transcriptional regulator MalT [compost metagenome]